MLSWSGEMGLGGSASSGTTAEDLDCKLFVVNISLTSSGDGDNYITGIQKSQRDKKLNNVVFERNHLKYVINEF
ncbi:MAG TPA: hypothetical protein PKW96_00310 [Candidatus Aminicenantes bacterium]|nr:hypothetical protein [Candidatus Aminicenantes bacterium]